MSGFRVGVFHAPRNDKESHSAASFASGAAARTSASTWASNLAKFFWNMPTSARAVLSNSALSFQVLTGLRMSLGTPGSAVGTAKPKYLSVRNSTLRKLPFSAAVSSARVTLIGIREPVPYLPPVQPVLTSQQHHVLGLTGASRAGGVGDEIERIGRAGIFRLRAVVEIRHAGVRVEHDVFQHRAETLTGGIDLRLGLARQLDALGVAAAFEIEDAVLAPAVLVVADQRALGIGRQRGLAGA